MAFKTVPAPDPAELMAKFVNLKNVGETLKGIFMSLAESTGQFGGTNYTFNTSKDGVVTITAKTMLLKHLQRADPKPGYGVIIKLSGEKDIGKESPLKLFEVQVDPDVTEQMKLWATGVPMPKGKSAAPPPPKPPTDDEDAPF